MMLEKKKAEFQVYKLKYPVLFEQINKLNKIFAARLEKSLGKLDKSGILGGLIRENDISGSSFKNSSTCNQVDERVK